MGNTNKFFGDYDNGLGLDLWYEVPPLTSTNNRQPQWSTDASKLGKYDDSNSPIYTSIFRQKDENDNVVSSSEFVASSQIYNDDDNVNDTSLISVIEHLQKWRSTFVDYSDFAYLKNLGVYPTNRLMIARRFTSPTVNNLYKINDSPIATMVSWMPEDSDFFKVTFGERWTQVTEATLTSVFNSIGEDFGTKTTSSLGDKLEGGLKFFSLPGVTEALQIELLKELGYVDYEANNPPSGNPNLIKEASQRKLVDKNNAGSGLEGVFSISFVVEYEQKYINGLDPSLIYMDIIQKSLMFGTSKSVFMFGTKGANQANELVKKLVSGDLGAMIKAISDFVSELQKAIGKLIELSVRVLTNLGEVFADPTNPNTGKLTDESKRLLGGVISKYRIKIFGVMQALSGLPSGYWHVTIGNPKKPFFSCGDLVTSSVTLTFGKVLAYNDLPSTIKIEFTLESARNLGGQEIMDTFNTGQGRTYLQRKRPYVEVPLGSDTEDYTNRRNKFSQDVRDIKSDSKINPGP